MGEIDVAGLDPFLWLRFRSYFIADFGARTWENPSRSSIDLLLPRASFNFGFFPNFSIC
jgi:hypothetical protein